MAPVLSIPLVPGVTLIGAPSEAGGAGPGAALGPDALRAARLVPALQRLGLDVLDEGNLSVPGDPDPASVGGVRRLAACVAWSHAVFRAVSRQLEAGRLPVLLGGDHHVAVGSISAVARHCRDRDLTLRVIWLDAHADCNTPASSASGNAHGMPVATLWGLGPPDLSRLASFEPALSPGSTCQIGLRSVDEPEKQLLQALGVEVYDMRAVGALGMDEVMNRALRGIQGQGVHLHVSLDVDVLDPSVAPGTGTPVPGGLTENEALLCMSRLAGTGCLGSLDVVEINPSLDTGNRTARRTVGLMQRLLDPRTGWNAAG